MDLNLKNRIVLVTGGASGIGKRICLDFASEGANVVIADINEAGAKAVAEEVRNSAVKAIAVKCDVTKTDEVKNAVKKCIDEFNRLDILVCNAGIIRDAMIHKMPEENYDLVMDINLKGYWRFCKEVVPIMKKQRYGKIIMISSMAYLGSRGQSNYSPAKAGVVALCKTLAQEVGYVGVNVNVIAPGLIVTPLTEEFASNKEQRTRIEKGLVLQRQPELGPKLGTPEDISNLTLFLASDRSSYITADVFHVSAGRKIAGA
ncbi:MAG: SDR family NAD(P)-dependent oxidoreductase [Candidatus Helarchaeota archaeon]